MCDKMSQYQELYNQAHWVAQPRVANKTPRSTALCAVERGDPFRDCYKCGPAYVMCCTKRPLTPASVYATLLHTARPLVWLHKVVCYMHVVPTGNFHGTYTPNK